MAKKKEKATNRIDSEGETILVSKDFDIESLDVNSLVDEDPTSEEFYEEHEIKEEIKAELEDHTEDELASSIKVRFISKQENSKYDFIGALTKYHIYHDQGNWLHNYQFWISAEEALKLIQTHGKVNNIWSVNLETLLNKVNVHSTGKSDYILYYLETLEIKKAIIKLSLTYTLK